MKKSSFGVVLFLLVCFSAYGQNERWFDPFFIEGAVHYYFPPEMLSEYIKPDLGFRGALGYEYRHFRFALESGYSHIKGTNPLVVDITLIPLAFKAGYELPIRWGLGVQADLGLGFVFSRTSHYDSAVNLFRKNMLDSQTQSFFAGARLFAAYTFPVKFLKLYVGGGLDMIIETGGVIPLAVFEGGISFKPLALLRPKTKPPREEIPDVTEKEEIPEEADKPEIVYTQNTVSTETEIPLFDTVYFEPDTAVLIERYRPVLDKAGERLKANGSARVTLRGYAAPFGTAESCVTVSRERAEFCMEYFIKKYGIEKDRIRIEYYGAAKEPVWKDAGMESRRCVELVFE